MRTGRPVWVYRCRGGTRKTKPRAAACRGMLQRRGGGGFPQSSAELEERGRGGEAEQSKSLK